MGYSDYLDPIIKTLQNSTNVIMIELICTFVNTLIEGSSDEKLREKIRKDFNAKKILKVYQ